MRHLGLKKNAFCTISNCMLLKNYLSYSFIHFHGLKKLYEKNSQHFFHTMQFYNKHFCHFLHFRGGSRIFSRGGRMFKKVWKILSTFFLGRPDWLVDFSQSTTKTLFWPKFCAACKILNKQAKSSPP